MKSAYILIAAVAVIATSPTAHAQTAFDGFAVQWETGYEHNHIAASAPKIANPTDVYYGTETQSTSASGVPLFVNLGYTFNIAPQWTLGAGVEHEFIDRDTKTLTSNFGGQGGYGKVTYFDQVSDQTNFYLAPGYVIGDDKMVFVKAGYSFESISLNAIDKKAKTSGGFMVGAGYKQFLTRHFYGTAEVHYAQYRKFSPDFALLGATLVGTTGTPSVLDVIVGVGFKF